VAERFDPFAHLPPDVRQKAISQVRMMRQIGLELTAVDTMVVNGSENFVLYFGQDNDVIVNLTVDRDAAGGQG
jgi:hypothetical protein